MKLSKISSLVLAAALLMPAVADAADMAPRKLKFASQSVGSTGYNRNSAMAQVMNQHMPKGWSVEVAPISTGGVAGTLLVEKGAADLGEGINVPNHMLASGKFSMKGKAMPVPSAP